MVPVLSGTNSGFRSVLMGRSNSLGVAFNVGVGMDNSSQS
jgi:hypothetical protein